ncbi:MAG TPA: glycosyltransferase family 39 protein [Solirubrobacteraceae bacterium]|jgi:4-amino-4-deoxy-L-arabinose transferase-like glycosyltransferase|nr:glycosyltransferase family 39 protein [Solirubrobacteraceae bacterium]
MHTARARRGWLAPLALTVVLAGALGLRLWGIAQGLPYAYNSDENAHFVRKAIAMFHGGLNPHYFANPPAFTYLLHGLYAVWFSSGAAAVHALTTHPTEVFVLGRIAATLLGTLAVWLLYLTGTRLFGRRVGLLAAALEAVAFLPVFYAHLALNDVPTLALVTLSLLGTSGVLRKGRRRDYALAGIGLGLGCASKYTAGIVVAPLLAAAACHYLDAPRERARVLGGLALAGALALASFLVANPYALLDFGAFHAELNHQSQLSGEAQGKLGAGHEGGVRYYLWSLTWGLGWLPALAALGGALTIWRSDRRVGWLLVPAALLFLAFMGLQGRYFGRWLLPIFPIVCLLAAFFAAQVATWLAARTPLPRVVALALAAVALCTQGLVYSIHSDLVLSREDTRTLTRAWMVAHIAKDAKIVAEPVSPDVWARDIGQFNPATADGARWTKYPSLEEVFLNGELVGPTGQTVGIEDYERTLRPALIGYYEREGYCWVIVGSTQRGRAMAEPNAVPEAVAYYRALARAGRVLYRVSPYAKGAGPVAFNFDWSFDYYPLAYHRPGPEMSVYRLSGGGCKP